MVSKHPDYQSFDTTEAILSMTSTQKAGDVTQEAIGTSTRFHGRYKDHMEMYATAGTVAEYLNNHGSWFSRCADPMKVEALGKNGYALVIGRFGSFGYEVEPKIGLELLPPEEGVYRICTIPIPDYQAPGYDVDYRAALQLQENVGSNSSTCLSEMTQVEWELDLSVYIHFPKFIQRLPKSLVLSTGERLLNQVVRQVSRRLTRKVQEDFHQSLGIPFPDGTKKK
ncbi:MAG: DUF1997 domain-containing protein [Brasilonema octagenarum HA4186-MV1]|jgi:hypothetical protein|uniref:DUF1997 domain-containing protein n=2 Tax=Brasilonema TaxID=383614 RepID=A0A856M943_9CYAN|nr:MULTISPECIES: DUF1997 domain-containing protein [Brasilonema]MBW4626703.1 DUF1997 domain-containing protein [Brasilonema octagenarum HA4186-MV1]NMF64466.1 hypothetical protein [Brasilonema octagenarum UFV-OR1]QDL07705.1 hypothetical protein DP114_07140 [Brasilonema sennae CENA114]QDL14067.1 hypothetical protein DP113_07100 [Brasilonema octagenarum UFV-E1]